MNNRFEDYFEGRGGKPSPMLVGLADGETIDSMRKELDAAKERYLSHNSPDALDALKVEEWVENGVLRGLHISMQ